MRAVGVLPGKREVRLLDHPTPAISKDNEIKVKSLEIGVCGTDREICTFVYGAPPAGFESSNRNCKVTAQLATWAEEDGRGIVSDSSGQFMLADGSALSPDAAWVSNVALHSVPRQKRKEFLPLCPEFVVEVMSPSDRLKQAKAKMEQWIGNGAQLAKACLKIDPA